MIWHDLEQGTAEWHSARLGIPTSSEFSKIVTPTGKLSSQSVAYGHTLLAEWLFQSPLEQFEGEWMIHGNEFEDEAARAYEFQRNVTVSPGGFFTTDDGMVGSSPDRLVEDWGLLEIKCPKANTHVGYMLSRGVDEKYVCQTQGQLWVCQRDRLHIESYCPGLPTVIVEVVRDEKFIGLLSEAMENFVAWLMASRYQLTREYGVHPKSREVAKEAPADLGVSEDDVADIWAGRASA